MKKTAILLGVSGLMLALLVVAGVYAQGPTASSPPVLEGGIQASDDTINFQGRLYTSAGAPVPAGNYNMRFTVCSASDCSSTVWGPTEFTAAVDAQGLFNVLLTPFNASHFIGNRWLRIEVCTTANQNPCASGWDTMTPYQPMTSVAIAIGNIRKNMVDTSTANSAGYILTVTNSGSGGALYGVSSNAAGVRGDGWYGLYGYSGNGGYGVYGTGTSGVWGVYGYSPDSYGVYGVSGTRMGVRGYASSTTADVDGVFGYAATGSPFRAPAGVSTGATGSVATAGDYGVFGLNTSTTSSIGVVGAASGTTIYLPPPGSSAGVVGSGGMAGEYGVFGINGNTTGQAFGVVAIASTTSINTPAAGSVSLLANAGRAGDHAIFASNTATSDSFGVIGLANSASYYVPGGTGGTAVSGSVGGASDWAVMGVNSNATGGYGLFGQGYYGLVAFSTDTTYPQWSGYFGQDVYVVNEVWAYDFVYHFLGNGGERALYGLASTESWFEDFGTATLVDGRAVVTIAPDFASTVNLNEDYHVFLTPLGECRGLYVAQKTPTSFEVHELGGGKSNITFDYRIVAKRAGREGLRLKNIGDQIPSVTATPQALSTKQEMTQQENASPVQLPAADGYAPKPEPKH